MQEKKQASKHQQFAELLDSKFRIPGTDIRFGIDPIIGLIPGAGDWIGGLASLYFIVSATILEARTSILLRMLLNILLDVIIGTIPFLGEVFDVGWKANLRNAKLLEELEQDPERTERQSKLIIWTVCLFSIGIVFALLYGIAILIGTFIEAIL